MQTIIDDYVIGSIEDKDKVVILIESKSGGKVSQVSKEKEYARFIIGDIEKKVVFANEFNVRRKITFEKWNIELYVDTNKYLNIYTPDGATWSEIIPSKSGNPTIVINHTKP